MLSTLRTFASLICHTYTNQHKCPKYHTANKPRYCDVAVGLQVYFMYLLRNRRWKSLRIVSLMNLCSFFGSLRAWFLKMTSSSHLFLTLKDPEAPWIAVSRGLPFASSAFLTAAAAFSSSACFLAASSARSFLIRSSSFMSSSVSSSSSSESSSSSSSRSSAESSASIAFGCSLCSALLSFLLAPSKSFKSSSPPRPLFLT
mmetsp:Transcript_12190/g.25585  ORF Transcript_12190/g.25585 Transcript_12190/m.25585 type:complete len:201 (-) Transcript_12190:341-943(-)